MITWLPSRVRTFTARHVISATSPSHSPRRIQCPSLNGFSTWIARPATKFPSVSCNARPATTAPTADVVRNFSCNTRVATSAKTVKTMTSCTIVGNRSGTRSAPSGLIVMRTMKWMSANAKRSCAIEASSVLVSAATRPVVASAALMPTNDQRQHDRQPHAAADHPVLRKDPDCQPEDQQDEAGHHLRGNRAEESGHVVWSLTSSAFLPS